MILNGSEDPILSRNRFPSIFAFDLKFDVFPLDTDVNIYEFCIVLTYMINLSSQIIQLQVVHPRLSPADHWFLFPLPM